MRAQMEAEAGQVDTAKKGNSLFAEVTCNCDGISSDFYFYHMLLSLWQ